MVLFVLFQHMYIIGVQKIRLLINASKCQLINGKIDQESCMREKSLQYLYSLKDIFIYLQEFNNTHYKYIMCIF